MSTSANATNTKAGDEVFAGACGADSGGDKTTLSGEAQARSLARVEEVIAEHGPALWRFCAGYEAQPAAREDLYQEILVALWRALPTFRGEASLRTFVYRVAHNRAVSHVVRHARRREREAAPLTEPVPDPRPTVVESLERREKRERLFAAIRALPSSLSEAVMLSLEGLSLRELGEVLGISENNAAVRLNRARNSLRRVLLEQGVTMNDRGAPDRTPGANR